MNVQVRTTVEEAFRWALANDDALEEISKLRAEIEALKNATGEDIKEAESNAKVLPTVIASVAVLGDIALALWFIIKRKIFK